MRTGGVSASPFDELNLSEGVGDDARAVQTNRARLMDALGLPSERIAYATQVHGATCLVPSGPGLAGTGDALATSKDDLVLVVGTADCLPILLWDAQSPRVAAVHAGWRGLAAGVPMHAVGQLVLMGAATASLRAALGPRIGPCCFEVGPDVAERFPGAERIVKHGRTTVDLARAAVRQLTAAGLTPDAIFDWNECSACDPERYFSHRRDAGRTGRSWGLVTPRPAGPRAAHESAV